MRPVVLVVLGVLALAAGSVAYAGAEHAQSGPQRVVLHTNDRFAVGGSRIACRVLRKSKRVSNRMHCFVETGVDTFVPKPRSYEVELAARAVSVVRVGAKPKLVFSHPETPPKGVPAGGRQAVPALGRLIHLQNRFDKVFVITTNIVCRPYGSSAPLGLLCVLIGGDGHVHDGTYLVLLTQRSVSIALAKTGNPVTVFRRSHGR